MIGYAKKAVLLLLGSMLALTGAAQSSLDADSWWSPGDTRVLPAVVEYDNAFGTLRVLNAAGPVDTEDHAFFTPLGANGRSCVTCHQPADGMGLSVATIKRRWHETGGTDPLFAAIDGSNCPSLPQDQAASHSLLLERGLFRIFLPWPPRTIEGEAIEPEFTIEVLSDPTGCNTDPVYGLGSENPMISVFRRPRPVANLKYITELSHGVSPHEYFYPNDKSLLPKDPDTGAFVAFRLMSDGREPTLKTQAVGAALGHLESQRPTDKQLAEIVAFENQIYVAQSVHKLGGELTAPGAPPVLGPEALRDGAPARLGNNPINRIFGSFAMWSDAAPTDPSSSDERAQSEFRRSVARGADVFYLRRFMIRDVGDYNDKGLGNPFKRSCGSGCHNMQLVGIDMAPGYMDLGLNNLPWANNRPDLPLFKIECSADAKPQSYLGRTLYTHDPGRALISGKCIDVGATLTQQMRGLAARAPYFANGSAANLRELVDFYDRRFNIGYTETEKQDLVNFMSTL
jgi:cytochrome c peroxidase